MRGISVLGSTGSIGTQTLDIVDGSDGELNVVALSAGRNIKLIEEQTRKYRPELICVHNEDDAAELAVRLKDIDVKIVHGMDGLIEVASYPKSDMLRAISDKKKGLGDFDVHIDDDALGFLSEYSNGDARVALNAIELAVLTTKPARDGSVHVDLDVAEDCIQKRPLNYDKDGDNHYDTISAFIKSMRGSDPDAAVFYLAKMLESGEDIKFIARRIMICASEDVGNADPYALVVATNAALAVERIGMPEARIILSQAALYVACAPKSNSCYMAVDKAMELVKTTKTAPVPAHLQDAHYKSASKLGHGIGYKYAHDYPNHYVKQQYLPDGLEDVKFYEPTDNGYEKQIKTHLKKINSET